MHIEPGVLNAVKILSANVAAVSTLGAHAPAALRAPGVWVKTLLAAAFFSVFMEIFHMPVGPSELHFIGASAVYFTFGFLPTLFGFALGLTLQGVLFEPQDLVHLGVNSLSLMLPLIATHMALGQRFFATEDRKALSWAAILRFDAAYYAGVVGMVGFWLFLGEEATPLQSWLWFAASYLPVVLCEPVFTYASLRLLKQQTGWNMLQRFTALPQLTVV
jgi:ABC-type Co2+ transport system permease subunit